jgi:hypothetical protein
VKYPSEVRAAFAAPIICTKEQMHVLISTVLLCWWCDLTLASSNNNIKTS